MILVADSGSTKTAWGLTTIPAQFHSEGLNPHFASDADIEAACNAVKKWLQGTGVAVGDITALCFYGAGCGDVAMRSHMESLLHRFMDIDNIVVETDLLGACRALCGDSAGIVGIIGTGSNACYYDGCSPVYCPVSTGYVLGDHGSGNHIGRRLLHDYLSGRMPKDISCLFHEMYGYSNTEFMARVYHQPNASRFLASLAPFAVQMEGTPYGSSVIDECLDDWYRFQLQLVAEKTSCRALSVVGGLAVSVENHLMRLAQKHGLELTRVLGSPLDELLKYHRIR